MEFIRIVIDTKGGDKGAESMVKGAALALKKFENLAVLLVGDKALLEQTCAALDMPENRTEILDAKDEITNYDSAAEALFTKPDASMVRALAALSERDDLAGMITAGNTGALLAGAMRYLPLETRVRPALAALLPAEKGGFVCLVDTGATVDCTPQMLHHFAKLGSAFMKESYGIEAPKVGLLSNGAERTKGNKLTKETFALLEADSSICFVGNIEGNRALSGDCEVLVCDGFAGNQVLKVTEGTATRIITDVFTYAHRNQSESAKALGAYLMSKYDLGSLGGGYILGVRKPVIKTRGNAGELAVVSVSQMLLNRAQNKALFDLKRNT